MEDDAADELDVEVAHADGAAAGLANDGEGLGEGLVEDVLFGCDAGLGIVHVGESDGGDGGWSWKGGGGFRWEGWHRSEKIKRLSLTGRGREGGQKKISIDRSPTLLY